MSILKKYDKLILNYSFIRKLTMLLIVSFYPTFIACITVKEDEMEQLKEKPLRKNIFSLDNQTSNNVNSERKSEEKYRDCTENIINKTFGRDMLIEYNYYPGYYLYPRCIIVSTNVLILYVYKLY